jgi:hypothetical protein
MPSEAGTPRLRATQCKVTLIGPNNIYQVLVPPRSKPAVTGELYERAELQPPRWMRRIYNKIGLSH